MTEAKDRTVQEHTLEVMDTISRMVQEGRRVEAARLLPDLTALMTQGAILETTRWPVCAQCLGYAEIPHQTESQRKVACVTEPHRCHGNQMGRMSPEGFMAYVEEMTQGVDITPGEQDAVRAGLRSWAERMKRSKKAS